MVMPIGVKIAPPTFQRAISKIFRKNLDHLMKIFLNDSMVYNDMERHLMKLKLCFQKCKKYIKFSDLMIVFQKCIWFVLVWFLLGFIL